MRKEAMMQILDLCKNADPAEVFRSGLINFDYKKDDLGRIVKVRTFSAPDGRSVAVEMSYCNYKDYRHMTLSELYVYYAELEEQYEECESHENDIIEDDIAEDDYYERWQDDLSEIEEEMECVMDKIRELETTDYEWN